MKSGRLPDGPRAWLVTPASLAILELPAILVWPVTRALPAIPVSLATLA
ncbi:MAG TPA: hypothetical protein VHD76_05590 [Bryobacteraceae bacterium]|jgi:hypothetical protein|nr:hypothetical protein [Bryobacteraceae bacterium]